MSKDDLILIPVFCPECSPQQELIPAAEITVYGDEATAHPEDSIHHFRTTDAPGLASVRLFCTSCDYYHPLNEDTAFEILTRLTRAIQIRR